MKHLLILTLLFLCLSTNVEAQQQGVPFIKNYHAADYGAHNRNFDIIADDNGIIYVANFEGMLYYDYAEWHVLHTPSMTRVNNLYRDKDGVIWVDGHHFTGRLTTRQNGQLALQEAPLPPQLPNKEEKGAQTIQLPNGLQAMTTNGKGVAFADKTGRVLYHISEKNGLCSNNVHKIAYDGHGHLFGATDNGIFIMAVPSAYSRFTPNEGLNGEVLCINRFDGQLYAGTLSGLYKKQGMEFEQVAGMSHACWQMAETPHGLLAATSAGVYLLGHQGIIRQLNDNAAMSLLAIDSEHYYTGELNGVYHNDLSGHRQLVANVENTTHIYQDEQGTLWLQNLFGQIYQKEKDKQDFTPYPVKNNEAATLVIADGKVTVVSSLDTAPLPYPQYSYCDPTGILWMTDNEGKHLSAWRNGKKIEELNNLLYPVGQQATRTMFAEGNTLWLGGEFGLVMVDRSIKDPNLSTIPHMVIRSVILNGDSVFWGGFGDCPQELQDLENDEHDLRFTFALEHPSVLCDALYRYRLNDGNWSGWSTHNDVRYNNLSSGSYTFEVEAFDPTGHITPMASISFHISYPFYLRWYMQILYFLMMVRLGTLASRWRLRRLEKEKQRLENIVQERTAEVVKQKDEIEEKSKSLETALHELGEAQHELIRQEKMATVGKLTQGLIDRILNPLNYINNFAKLSEGLVKDIENNIEDDHEAMTPDIYDDTIDVLGMLRGNLQKVSEHGQNTTRTLKAMEEMLKDRSGGIIPMNLGPILRQDEEMLRRYYATDIAATSINIHFDIPEEPLPLEGNAELLSKTFMSLLSNSVYAVVKKAQRESFQPEINVSVKHANGNIVITIFDNGIGIEKTIIDKIFDPFFTTKPTGEASGVGLYLSREIIQNHKGDITVKSEQYIYSEFVITLPESI